jgi:hypothetical protein
MQMPLRTPGWLPRGIRLPYFPCVSREEMRRRTSSQGTVDALPESSSSTRRLISSFHAVSAPWSIDESRLSIREHARFARSSSESESAFCRRSRACRVTRQLYRVFLEPGHRLKPALVRRGGAGGGGLRGGSTRRHGAWLHGRGACDRSSRFALSRARTSLRLRLLLR